MRRFYRRRLITVSMISFLILFTLIVHVFFSFLTVWLVAKYAKKHDRLEMRVFLVPAAVILLFFSVEVFVGLTPGILSILAHEAGLLFFGFLTIRRASNG